VTISISSSLIVPVGQELWKGLPVWLWLHVSRAVVFRRGLAVGQLKQLEAGQASFSVYIVLKPSSVVCLHGSL
jgi:hypothetical protein